MSNSIHIEKDVTRIEQCNEEEILYSHSRDEEAKKEHKAIYNDDEVLIDVLFYDDGRFDRVSIAHSDGWSIVSKEITIYDVEIDFGSESLFTLRGDKTADLETVAMIRAIQNFFCEKE